MPIIIIIIKINVIFKKINEITDIKIFLWTTKIYALICDAYFYYIIRLEANKIVIPEQLLSDNPVSFPYLQYIQRVS